VSAARLRFEQVTKTFRDRTAPRTLRDAIPSAVSMLLGRPEPPRTRFVALERVSFAVAPGEALGLVGRNGAGKSTSLKLAAGIYRPDEGRVVREGRVASMIELSAGFHPDLSGRENVYLNGALLGLRRREVAALMPRIVAFADIGPFVDAPLRVYSSGMAVRLGFAVASHVPAELLLVDEVLAVGDLDFHTRCVERMAARRREGVSVLFVSHNLAVVEQFCDRVLVVDRGRKVEEGDPVTVVDAYRRRVLAQGDHPSASGDLEVRRGSGEVVVRAVEVVGESGSPEVVAGRPFSVRVHLTARPDAPAPTLELYLHAPEGTLLSSVRSRGDAPGVEPVPGDSVAEVRFGRNDLLPGAYVLSVFVRDPRGLGEYDLHERAYRVAVHGERPEGVRGAVDLSAAWHRPRGAGAPP